MREDSFDMGSYDPEMDGYEPPEVSIADVTKGSQIGEGSFLGSLSSAAFPCGAARREGGSLHGGELIFPPLCCGVPVLGCRIQVLCNPTNDL